MPTTETEAPEAPAAPLKITEDDRAALLGFDGRAKALQLEAQAAMAALAAEQEGFLGRLAARLGLPDGKALDGYAIRMDTLTLEPKVEARP